MIVLCNCASKISFNSWVEFLIVRYVCCFANHCELDLVITMKSIDCVEILKWISYSCVVIVMTIEQVKEKELFLEK